MSVRPSIRNKRKIDYKETSPLPYDEKSLPSIKYQRMTDEQRDNLPSNFEEIHEIHFPIFHDIDNQYWVKVKTRFEFYYCTVIKAIKKFPGNSEKNMLSYIDFLKHYKEESFMTNELWTIITNYEQDAKSCIPQVMKINCNKQNTKSTKRRWSLYTTREEKMQ